MTETTGALVIGGTLNGLSIARSLGRHGVPVWVATPSDVKLAKLLKIHLPQSPLAGWRPLKHKSRLIGTSTRYKLIDGCCFQPATNRPHYCHNLRTALTLIPRGDPTGCPALGLR